MKLYNDLKQVWNQNECQVLSWLIRRKKKEKEDETKKNPNTPATPLKLKKIHMATCYTTDLWFLRNKNLDQQSFSI